MYTEDDDKKYKELVDDLKNLKKIEAPVGFENKLWKKINSGETVEEKSVWRNLTTRLVPAAAVLVVAVILFVVIENNAYEYQDPFLIEPVQRTDLIEFSAQEQNLIERDKLPETKSVQPEKPLEEKPSVVFRKKETPAPEALSMENQIAGRSETIVEEDSLTPETTAVTTSMVDEVAGHDENLPSAEMKQGLNFRQVQLSEQEKQEVNELKNRALRSVQSKQK
jgi:hypothetical protein